VDRHYINGRDKSDGVYGFDYDSEGKLISTERFPLDIYGFGVSGERADYLKEKGYMLDCARETGEGGMHLSLNITKRFKTE
jgi:hypothetical protein